jgi:hypothetical protein
MKVKGKKKEETADDCGGLVPCKIGAASEVAAR